MNKDLFLEIESAELAHLYDFIPDVQFWIKDKSGVFQWVNRSFLNYYAISQMSEVVGKTDFDLSPYYIAFQFEQDDKLILKGKVIINRIELLSGADKTVSFYMTNKRLIKNKTGSIVGTIGISRKLSNQQNPEIPITKLSEIVKYIHDNIHQPISIVTMAGKMHCSISSLERMFKRLLQATPMEVIRKIKMQYASNALINSDSTVSEIAFSLGYADQSHFIREFKKLMKQTPFQYRKHYYNMISFKK